MATTLTFKRAGIWRRYTITHGATVVGNLTQPSMERQTTARLNGRDTTITRTSWLSPQLDVTSAGLRAVYAPAPLSGSIVRRAAQLFEREGMITLNGRTYRFTSSGLGRHSWSLDKTTVINYTFKLLNEQGEIEVGSPLAGDEDILVPLGLHVALKRRRNDSSTGFVAAVG